MADIYFWKGTKSQEEVQIVYHMDTPAGNNAEGVSNAAAVLLSGYSSGKSILPSGDGTQGTLDPAEREKIALGTRIEWLATYSIAKDGPTTIGNVRARRTADIILITDEISRIAGLYGFAGS